MKKILGRGFTDTSLLIRGGGGGGGERNKEGGGGGGGGIEHMKKWGGGLGMTTTPLCDCSFYLTIRIFTGRINSFSAQH